jgi:hypothetical protein
MLVELKTKPSSDILNSSCSTKTSTEGEGTSLEIPVGSVVFRSPIILMTDYELKTWEDRKTGQSWKIMRSIRAHNYILGKKAWLSELRRAQVRTERSTLDLLLVFHQHKLWRCFH